MCVSVEHSGDGITRQRLFETAAPEERKDLRRLAFDRGLNGGVVQDGDQVIVPKPGERGLQLQRFSNRFVHEFLDDVFAPRAQGTPAEATGETLDPGKPDPQNLGRAAVERYDAGIFHDAADFILLAGLVVMVAEHADDRNLHARRQFLCECARFLGETVVGQIAADDQDVSRLGDAGEERLQRPRRRRFSVMQVADRRDAHGVARDSHAGEGSKRCSFA
jgi:hypothetical protein